MLWRKWTVGLAVVVAGCLLAVSAALAKPGMVITRDGQAFEGDIDDTSTPGKVIVTDKRGIKTALPRAAVERPFYYDSNNPRAEFDAQMAKGRLKPKGPKDVSGQLAAAHWAIDHKQYEMAKEALDEAARNDPANPDVKALQQSVEKQLAASPSGTTQPGAATRPSTGDGGNGAGGPKAPAKRMVTQKEIQTIRKLEWRQGDRTIKVKVPPDVRKRFIDSGLVPDAAQLPQNDLAFEILQHGPPALREQVQIVSDPAPIVEFRQKVEKHVVQASCLQCHAAGKLQGEHNQLALFPGDTEQAAYTNFIVLQQYSKEIQLKPKDRSIEYAMIDRTRPEGSLLTQYALPPDFADVPHPEAKAYKGAVKNKTDMRFQELMGWIESLAPIPPDYSFIDLTLTEPPPEARDPVAKPAAPGPAPRAGTPRAGS
jgi:hypothetical protein